MGLGTLDWTLPLKGDMPWTFLIEICIRVFFLYGLIIVAMRLMGRRMGAQLTRNEMAALVSLAATIGIPMQTPQQGLLPALVAAGTIVGLQWFIARCAYRNERFEKLTMDNIDILVADGRLQMGILRRTTLSREYVVARLRSEGIDHLGKVRRLYMESNGAVSVWENAEPRPGLSLIPDMDAEMRRRQVTAEGCFACRTCGHLEHGTRPSGRCPECGAPHWTEAVTSA